MNAASEAMKSHSKLSHSLMLCRHLCYVTAARRDVIGDVLLLLLTLLLGMTSTAGDVSSATTQSGDLKYTILPF